MRAARRDLGRFPPPEFCVSGSRIGAGAASGPRCPFYPVMRVCCGDLGTLWPPEGPISSKIYYPERNHPANSPQTGTGRQGAHRGVRFIPKARDSRQTRSTLPPGNSRRSHPDSHPARREYCDITASRRHTRSTSCLPLPRAVAAAQTRNSSPAQVRLLRESVAPAAQCLGCVTDRISQWVVVSGLRSPDLVP